jgi:dolichol-phosphate mannosyltransferase
MDASTRLEPISLVIPAFDEAAVIHQAVREAEAALAGLFVDYEILVVDDGSSDETAAVVQAALQVHPHTRLLRHPVNRGYGAALRTGFEAARFRLVAFTDADCQFDLTDLGPMARLAEEVPLVVGIRTDRQDPWQRRFFSWGYNKLARLFLGTRVRDVDCALKVFQRAALAELLPESRGFFVNTEMMTRARQLGLAVAEMPVAHRPRASGESKVSLREIPRTAAKLLRFWWSNVLFAPRPASVRKAVFQTRVAVTGGVAGRIAAPPPSTAPAHPVALPARSREAV